MKVFLEKTIASVSTNSLDETCLQSPDGHRSVLDKRQLLIGVLLVEILKQFDCFAFRLSNGVFREVTVSKQGGLVAVTRC